MLLFLVIICPDLNCQKSEISQTICWGHKNLSLITANPMKGTRSGSFLKKIQDISFYCLIKRPIRKAQKLKSYSSTLTNKNRDINKRKIAYHLIIQKRKRNGFADFSFFLVIRLHTHMKKEICCSFQLN